MSLLHILSLPPTTLPHPLHSPQLRANAPSTGSPSVSPSGLASSLSPSQSSLLGAPAPKSVLSASAAPSDPLPSPDWLPPPTRLRRSPPSHTWFWGRQELRVGIRASRPPGLRQMTDPRPAITAASRLSVPAASPPAPPRCRSEEDALRVRAAAPAAASLQHRLTAASAPGPAPQARALDHAALTDKLRGQCEGAEAASPGAPLAHLLPRADPGVPAPGHPSPSAPLRTLA